MSVWTSASEYTSREKTERISGVMFVQQYDLCKVNWTSHLHVSVGMPGCAAIELTLTPIYCCPFLPTLHDCTQGKLHDCSTEQLAQLSVNFQEINNTYETARKSHSPFLVDGPNLKHQYSSMKILNQAANFHSNWELVMQDPTICFFQILQHAQCAPKSLIWFCINFPGDQFWFEALALLFLCGCVYSLKGSFF